MKILATGISGSGRIELLDEMAIEIKSRGKTAKVYDVGDLISKECKKQKIPSIDERALDLDRSQIRLLRASALKNVELDTLRYPEIDFHLIGLHATFRWKGRLIPGISYTDLISLSPDYFLNVVDGVEKTVQTNHVNPKWKKIKAPDAEETQDWMIEEEFITEVLAEVMSKPMYLIARNHPIGNLVDLFSTNKKKIYLSYPITAVREDNPEIFIEIQDNFLGKLHDNFVVFNPLDIKDMPLTYLPKGRRLPDLAAKITEKSKDTIKSRTIERDFQFIDQADAVVVLYFTEKLSPGVMAEIFYAHRNQTPVFMVMEGKKSPFLEDAVTIVVDDIDSLFSVLNEFANNDKM